MTIPKPSSWWTFRGDQAGCGKDQQVVMSSAEETISWGEGFSWIGSTELFLKVFTPAAQKTHKEIQ
jgi:hypothetical protein